MTPAQVSDPTKITSLTTRDLISVTLLALIVRMFVGGMWPGWGTLLAPVFEAALWPVASVLLLAPQRRAPDRDAHRPL